MIRSLAAGMIVLCVMLSMANPSASQQSEPNKVDWSSKALGTRVVGKVVETNNKNRGAYIWPDMGSYLLFVTFSNAAGAEDMPKPGERVEIEYVASEVGDKLATVTGPDNKSYYGHKVVIVGKREK
jgi:hypothetical protein